MAEIQKQSEAQVSNLEAQNKIDKSNLTPEQQEVQNKIDDLRKKLDAIGATEKITKKAVEILYKGLTGDPSIKTDPEAKPTIELLERYKKAFEQAKNDKKITETELKSVTDTISRIGDKIEYTAGIDEKGEKLKFDNEKLKTILSREFLSLKPEERLQYVTQDNIDSNIVASGSVKDVTFNFDQDSDGKINRELYMLTTAGQVLPKEVREVTKDGQTYSRIGLKGEFYSGEKRLTIHDKTNVTIGKLGTPEELNSLEQANLTKYNEFVEKNSEFSDEKYKNAITEALEKNIEPKMFLKVLSRRIEEFEQKNPLDKVEIEFIATEVTKVPGYKNEGIDTQAKVLRYITPTTWKESLKELGFEQSSIDSYYDSNKDDSKFDSGKLDNFTPAEYSYPAERSESGTTLCSKTARLNLSKLGIDNPSTGGSARDAYRNLGSPNSDFPPKDSSDKVADFYLDASSKNREYGHRVAAFKAEDGQWFVLDPYYSIGNNRSRMPISAEKYVSEMKSKGHDMWGAKYYA